MVFMVFNPKPLKIKYVITIIIVTITIINNISSSIVIDVVVYIKLFFKHGYTAIQ